MNTDLTDRIKQYLKLETSYAIIINGDYGIGKTHYLKKELFPIVRTINSNNSSTPKKKKSFFGNESTTENDNFIPILISLFGTKSIDDIQYQIFAELYPFFKKKGVKIAAGLGKTLYRYFSKSEFKDLLTNTDSNSGNFIDYTKILLCIDDLDRKSKDLNLKEVFGFVNELVENHGAKILLVANEDHLRKEFDSQLDKYEVLKEKVIGVTYEFRNEVETIFNEIITTKYKTSLPQYFNFLNKNSKEVIERINQNNGNIRNLLFFLEHFKIVFEELSKKLELKENERLKEYRSEILEYAFSFTIPISIEYKSGRLNPNNFEEIKKIHQGLRFNIEDFLDSRPSMKVADKKEEKSYEDIYEEKYFIEGVSRRYHDSIFNYLTGQSSFKIDDLIKELELIYTHSSENLPEHEKLINKLGYWSCINLEEAEYIDATNKMLEYADEGLFGLVKYPVIFHFATRFNNVIGYDIPELVQRIKDGIRVGKDNFDFTGSIRFHLTLDGNSEFPDETKEIIEYCWQINDAIKVTNEEDEIKKLFEAFKDNIDDFVDEIQDSSKSKYIHSPLYNNFDLEEFWLSLKEVSNDLLIMFSYHIERRFTAYSINNNLSEELGFLNDLKAKLVAETQIEGLDKIKQTAYNLLLVKIEKVLKLKE